MFFEKPKILNIPGEKKNENTFYLVNIKIKTITIVKRRCLHLFTSNKRKGDKRTLNKRLLFTILRHFWKVPAGSSVAQNYEKF